MESNNSSVAMPSFSSGSRADSREWAREYNRRVRGTFISKGVPSGRIAGLSSTRVGSTEWFEVLATEYKKRKSDIIQLPQINIKDAENGKAEKTNSYTN